MNFCMAFTTDSLGIGVSNVDHNCRFLAGGETVDKRCHEERSRRVKNKPTKHQQVNILLRSLSIEVHNDALSSMSR